MVDKQLYKVLWDNIKKISEFIFALHKSKKIMHQMRLRKKHLLLDLNSNIIGA